MTTDLDARYGRTAERRRRGRILAIAAAASTALVLVAWLVWAGLQQPGASLQARDVGFELVADDAVLVRFEVSTAPGTAVVCALEAQNEQHAIVGWKVVELAASSERTRVIEERVVTSEPAVVASVALCRVR